LKSHVLNDLLLLGLGRLQLRHYAFVPKKMENAMTYIQVMSTVEKKEDAEKIAREVLGKRLAACVQILGPMQSFFHWQGKIDQAEEFLCLFKSRHDLYEELEKIILTNHPYDVPEILAIPIANGSSSYLNWMGKELKQG